MPLLPILIVPFALTIARTICSIGAVGMTAFGWFVVDRWMRQSRQAAHATPAWIIPVVGMLDLPLAMPALRLQSMHGVMASPLPFKGRPASSLIALLGLATIMIAGLPLRTLFGVARGELKTLST